MDFLPSSSGSSPPDLSLVTTKNSKNCEVCGKVGHGNHFGAITCRACAAFFRRYGLENTFTHCDARKRCGPPVNGVYRCKACRLQKCWDLGMTCDNVQFLRDSFFSQEALKAMEETVPQSMNTFTGRPNLIIFRTPPQKSNKRLIDIQFLINKASEILSKGVESPIIASNSLEKLALGLQSVQRKPERKEARIISKVGQEEITEIWQNDVIKVAKWLTHFDEFQKLPHEVKMDMLKGIWIVWNSLEKLATQSMLRREKVCKENQIVIELEDERVIMDRGSFEIDLSWCSRYSMEQLKFFSSTNIHERIDFMVKKMSDLQPTNIELTYMLCQLCLHHVGRRFQGEILEVSERLQEILANDLHNYYSKVLETRYYSCRIASMMNVNNLLRQGIQQRRARTELMHIFDVFNVEYSDPEMFRDF